MLLVCVETTTQMERRSGVTEVRSKILTPLETTGENSISLEEFEKNAFYNLKLYAR